MKRVTVEETCVACGTCVEICPEVFDLPGDIAIVREDADLGRDAEIEEAAESCPVDAIKYER